MSLNYILILYGPIPLERYTGIRVERRHNCSELEHKKANGWAHGVSSRLLYKSLDNGICRNDYKDLGCKRTVHIIK